MRRAELAVLERVAVTPLAERREFAAALAEADEAALRWLLESPMLRPAWRRKAVEENLARRSALRTDLAAATKPGDLKRRLADPRLAWQWRLIRDRLRELRRERKAKRAAEKAEATARLPDPDGPDGQVQP